MRSVHGWQTECHFLPTHSEEIPRTDATLTFATLVEPFLRRVPVTRSMLKRIGGRCARTVYPGAALACWAVVTPGALPAQGVRGSVAEAGTGEPIPGAIVLLSTAPGRIEAAARTDASGGFALPVAAPGQYRLQARRIGYAPDSARIELAANEVVEVRINLRPAGILLEEVVVYGRAAETAGQREFLSRQNLPWGHWLDRERIARTRQRTVRDVVRFQVPALGDCALVYLDGRRESAFGMDIPLDWVYGIEVYRSYFNVPIRYRDPFREGSRCGAILIWTTTPR